MYYYKTDRYTYKYTCTLVRQTTFSTTQQLYTKDTTTIASFERSGVRLLVVQTGTIGIVDFQALLLTFTSGVGLLSVARVIVDVLAGFCWGGKMTTDSHLVEEEEEGEQETQGTTRKDQIIRFIKYPFMKLRDNKGNIGDRILPWGQPSFRNRSEPTSPDVEM